MKIVSERHIHSLRILNRAHAILFNPRYDKWRKLEAYRKWVASGQPCLFGKAAAKTKSVFVCILEEHEILRMRNGDVDLRETIQDHRQVWKRYALEGSFSSFMVLLLSKKPGKQRTKRQAQGDLSTTA